MGNETTKITIIIVLSVIATMYLGACLSKIFSSANYGNYPSYYAKEKSEKNI